MTDLTKITTPLALLDDKTRHDLEADRLTLEPCINRNEMRVRIEKKHGVMAITVRKQDLLDALKAL